VHWADLPLTPSTRTLRQFGGLLVVFVIVVAARRWLAGEVTTALTLLSIAGAVGILAASAPSLLRPVFVASLVVAFPIGWVVSRLILFLLFAAVITPVALLIRMSGRDVLHLRRPTDTSYWTSKPAAPDLVSYFRQF
jgi:Saxitoxin biosynthesis operon protein SxtJ